MKGRKRRRAEERIWKEVGKRRGVFGFTCSLSSGQ